LDDSAEVLNELFKHHTDALYRYAMYSLPRDVDARDVVQEVFLRAFRNWGEFKGNSDPKTWLFRIARNYMYDLLRRKQRERIAEVKMSSQQALTQLDTVIELEEVLQVLSFSHRQVLNLRWIQDMSVAESAEVLGWSESKVRVTFHRAKKRLRELLRDSTDSVRAPQSNGGDTAHGN
jgi:RNA polymerase sigma-70 factor, ECF subfamily